MSIIDFPNSPSNGDTYTFDNKLWTFDGEKWETSGGSKGQKGEPGPGGGEKGEVGPTGATGPTGGKGEKGEVGVQGPAGSSGVDGDKGQKGESGGAGPQGNVGPTGPASTVAGPQGPTGPTGAKGEKGEASTVVGPAGPQGPAGATGPTGPAGATGDKGDTGAGGSQTLTLGANGNLSISGGNNVDLRQTQYLYSTTSDLPSASTYHGAIAHVHSEGALYFAHSGSWNKLANHGADLQPASISADSTDGNNLSVEGGDATGLNSIGGNVIVDAGSGALQNGYVNVGQNSDGVYIGANSSTAIGLTGTVTVNNQLVIEDGVSEKFSSLTGATGVVTHDCDNGHIFYHTSISANFTANFTNLGLSTNYSTNLVLILNQGATARIPSAVQISGSAQTINWQGGSAPTGTANGVDAVSFTILRVSGTYVVLGQLVDFT